MFKTISGQVRDNFATILGPQWDNFGTMFGPLLTCAGRVVNTFEIVSQLFLNKFERCWGHLWATVVPCGSHPGET